MVATLPGEVFLNDFYIDQTLRAAAEPQLYFNGVFPDNPTTSRSVIYDVVKNTAAKDIEKGIMTIPQPAKEQSTLAELKMTNISEVKGKIPKIGYRMELSRDMLSSKNKTQSELDLRLKKAAYGMAYSLNAFSLQVAQKGAKTSPFTPDVTWEDTTGVYNPVLDMNKIYHSFIDKGYPNRALWHYMNQPHIESLTNYLINRKIAFQYINDYSLQITAGGVLNGMTFTNVYDQYQDGHMFSCDLRPTVHPGMETWTYNDPAYAVELPGTPDGSSSANEPPEPNYSNIQVNIQQQQLHPLNTIVEVWMNVLPTVKVEEVLMDTSGI